MRHHAVVTLATLLSLAGLFVSAQQSTPDRAAASAPPGAGSSPADVDPDGAALFATYCATCHEGGDPAQQAPTRDVMRRLTAEQVLDALERGSMRARAAERSRAQRRALAIHVSGKPLANATPDPMPPTARCRATAAPATTAFVADPLGGPAWNGWGLGLANARFQPRGHAGLSAADIPRLGLKWAFGLPGAASAGTQPTVLGGRLYIATAEGLIYALDAKTGCVHWTLEVNAGIRTAIVLDRWADGRVVAYVADQSGQVYAIDAVRGMVVWTTEVDEHPHAAITGAPQAHRGRLYVPISSREESQVGDPRYPCCTFRGSVVALDAATGRRIWKTFTIAEPAVPTATNSRGTQLSGPAGGAVWNTPTIDERRGAIYIGTGNNFAPPATPYSDSLLALDLETGRIRWSRQVTANDIWNGSCRQSNREPAVCPDKDAPDFDFTSSPILVPVGGNRDLIVVGNKSGLVLGIDPDADGAVVWQRRIAKGSSSGGIFWGSASAGTTFYAASADHDEREPAASGGLFAIDVRSGAVTWAAPGAGCEGRSPCKPSQAAAVTLIDGAVFSGTMDGRLRAHATGDGRVLWNYDTAREFDTVNGVKANGGSMSNGGAVVVDGMVYVNSGYSHHGGILPGNVLLAFSPK